MYHTIDELLSEVNRIAQKATVDELRDSVTRNVVTVYKKVDAPSLWQGAIHNYVLANVSSIALPPYCVFPLDVVSGRMKQSDFSSSGRYISGQYQTLLGDRSMGYPLAYERSGNLLYLQPSTDVRRYFSQDTTITGDVTLSYWRIPLDEQGSPLIDDRIWDAARFYCQADEARIDLHSRNKQSFSGLPYQVDSNLANAAIDAARAFCNKMAPADWRAFWNGIYNNQPG